LTLHAADAGVTGIVVDQSGRAIPRARVRVLDASNAERAAVFSGDEGAFAFDTDANCRLEVTLTGFEPATAPCGTDVRIELAVAPLSEQVIVSATRTPAPLEQTGASATVFTSDDLIARQTPLIADLLQTSTGATIMRTGAPGAVTSLFVRGGESDYNKVLLDGVPINEPGGTYYFSNLSTENLERVEVIRGAYSSLYGSDAMGSVIQLFTKQPDGTARRASGTAQFDAGSYDALHSNISAAGSTGRVGYSFGAARLTTDNRAPNSRLENTTLSGSAAWRATERTTLRFVGRGELEHVGTPGPTAFGRPDLDAFFERHDGVGGVTLDSRISPRFTERLSYSLALSHQQSTNLHEDAPYIAEFDGRTGLFTSTDFLTDTRNTFRRHHASYQADVRLPHVASAEQILTVLADWDGERAALADRRADTETRRSRNNVGGSVQEQLLWPRLFVTVGGRIEHNDAFGTAAVPRASAVYVVNPGSAIGETRLKASAGWGIKEPNLQESYSLSPYALGNASLDPERSRSVEAGLEQRAWRDRLKVSVTYFNNRFSDIINIVTTDPATFSAEYRNVGTTDAHGIEVQADAAPVRFVRARAGYSLLQSKVVKTATPEDPVFGLGQPLFRRPKHSGFVGATVSSGRTTVDVEGIFVGEFLDSDFGLFDTPLTTNPGHTLWNARASFAFTRRLSGLLTADNIGNTDYSEPFGYQPLLRSIRAGLRVGF
jgi:outer membrane cobalamin receptor